MALPIYSKNGFQEHSSVWDVVDSTRVLLDTGMGRQRFRERQAKGTSSPILPQTLWGGGGGAGGLDESQVYCP